MLVHHARDDSTRVLDHFVTVPGLGLSRRGETPMDDVGIDFTPESSQFFRIGAASCAVPGRWRGSARHIAASGRCPGERCSSRRSRTPVMGSS